MCHFFVLKWQVFYLFFFCRIQDLVLDSCEEKLIILDSGKIIQAKLSPNNEIKFETVNPLDNEKAQLISTFNNRLIYTTKNPKIFHSDGFSLKSKFGSTLCSSHPDKSYNIRKIRVFQDSVFLLDAHNLVIWKYDLNSKPSEVCQLEIWTHLDHAKQPHNMALLNAQQDCISTTILDHSSSKTSSAGSFITRFSLSWSTHYEKCAIFFSSMHFFAKAKLLSRIILYSTKIPLNCLTYRHRQANLDS